MYLMLVVMVCIDGSPSSFSLSGLSKMFNTNG